MITSPPKLVVTRATARAARPSLLTSTRQDIGGSHVERKVVLCNVDFEDLGVAPAEAPQFMTYGANREACRLYREFQRVSIRER
jgi:hypothetical protein